MKLVCRVTIICVYLSSLIMRTFESFASLMASSSLEKPAPGGWTFQNPRLLMMLHPSGPRVWMMITPVVEPTLTIAKARNFLQQPHRHVPPPLRSSRVYPPHRLIQQASICTRFLLWRLLPHRTRPDRLQLHFGTLMTRLGQEGGITPVLLRIGRPSRVSASYYNYQDDHRVHWS